MHCCSSYSVLNSPDHPWVSVLPSDPVFTKDNRKKESEPKVDSDEEDERMAQAGNHRDQSCPDHAWTSLNPHSGCHHTVQLRVIKATRDLKQYDSADFSWWLGRRRGGCESVRLMDSQSSHEIPGNCGDTQSLPQSLLCTLGRRQD